MKIDTKPLGIGKSFIDVSGSWGQIDKADELMIALYTIDDTQDDMLKSLKAEREMMKKAMDFFKDIFKLDTKQTKQIFNKVDGQVMNLYISYACGLIKGAEYQSFADFQKAVQAPKEMSTDDQETPKE